jgi:hypothetical protein
MTNISDALAELRGYVALWETYQEFRSGLYNPDQPADKPFDLGDFSDDIDPDHPAPAADLFDPNNFDHHECDWGSGCPYRGGPGMTYRDDPDGPDDEDDDDECSK